MTDTSRPGRLSEPLDQELDDAVAAVALGIATAEQGRQVQAARATDPAIASRLAEYAAVAAALLTSTPPAEPPSALKGRIFAAVEATSAAPPTPIRPIRSTEPTRALWRARPVDAAFRLAAVLAVVIGIGAWWVERERSSSALRDLAAATARTPALERRVTELESQLGDVVVRTRAEIDNANRRANDATQQAEQLTARLGLVSNTANLRKELLDAVAAGRFRPVIGAAEAPSARGLLVLTSQRGPKLLLDNLPPLKPNETYQAWTIKGAAAVPDVVFGADAMTDGIVSIQNALDGVSAVAITIEPSPTGSRTPTLPILAIANLDGA